MEISPFPRPTRVYRRPRRRQRADTNYKSNITTSTLCRLPLELILHIAAYLSDVDILTLSLTCRQLRFDLHPLSRRIDPIAEQTLLYERLRKDRYPSAALKEKSHPTSKKLLCSSCHTKHPSSHFPPRAFLESALTRSCTGTRDRLRICGHRNTGTTTFNALRGLTREPYHGPILLCPQTHRGNTTHHLSLPAHDLHFRDLAPWTWFLTQRTDILNLGTSTSLPTSDVHDAFIIANRYICPHLNTQNELLFHRLHAKLLRRHGTGGGRDGMWPCDATAHGELVGNCRWKECETWYSLFVEEGWLRMEVRRELGPLRDPNLGGWRAQLEGWKGR
ncbi:hypothetical protein B0J11DRAFT_578364 [Dendryphion nanum]|uniref:F-box domain-containing protein n=1 Tax=Dendryphion nanum TaxID=256645 RepID=A0A9P9DXE9_9PLEO|nr:hypothetical protein B0J11DRAFT_578364 [Dendryphion nanum]